MKHYTYLLAFHLPQNLWANERHHVLEHFHDHTNSERSTECFTQRWYYRREFGLFINFILDTANIFSAVSE